jgi:nitrile hydratase accessory protein
MSAGSATQSLDAELGGVAPLPRSNGELVFAEPWESRAFGMAVGLHEQGLFAWDEFRRALIERIRAWESSDTGEPYVYYEHWLGALEDVLTHSGIVRAQDIRAAVEAQSARSHDADHRHAEHHAHVHERPVS